MKVTTKKFRDKQTGKHDYRKIYVRPSSSMVEKALLPFPITGSNMCSSYAGPMRLEVPNCSQQDKRKESSKQSSLG